MSAPRESGLTLPIDPSLDYPAELLDLVLVGENGAAATQHQPVVFPYTGQAFAWAPVADAAHAATALDAAERAAPTMGALTSAARRSLIDSVAFRLGELAEQFVRLLVLETGKPEVDCRVEVARTLTTWQAAADEITRLSGETVPLDLQPLGAGMLGYYTRRPAGPVLGIAGFNYPVLLASHKIAPALAVGCPIIVKPSPDTPLATAWMVGIIREELAEAGLPRAAVQLINGSPEVGGQLVADPRIAVVSFTGSAAVGHAIARNAAPRKALLELGSNTALIVAEDADIPAAVDAVVRGGFYANGQACISVQRIVLHEAVAEEFTSTLLSRLPEVVVGDPRDPATRVAPVINARSAERIDGWVNDAVGAGARLLAGGPGGIAALDAADAADAADAEGGAEAAEAATADPTVGLVAPTVLADVPRDAAVWAEEIFGPVVCLRTVSSMNEAINLVNDSRYGLQAAVYTASLNNAFQAIDRLDVGGVVVNEIPGFRSDVMPYGGVKDSGIGREGPRWAMEEFTVTRMAMIRPL